MLSADLCFKNKIKSELFGGRLGERKIFRAMSCERIPGVTIRSFKN